MTTETIRAISQKASQYIFSFKPSSVILHTEKVTSMPCATWLQGHQSADRNITRHFGYPKRTTTDPWQSLRYLCPLQYEPNLYDRSPPDWFAEAGRLDVLPEVSPLHHITLLAEYTSPEIPVATPITSAEQGMIPPSPVPQPAPLFAAPVVNAITTSSVRYQWDLSLALPFNPLVPRYEEATEGDPPDLYSYKNGEPPVVLGFLPQTLCMPSRPLAALSQACNHRIVLAEGPLQVAIIEEITQSKLGHSRQVRPVGCFVLQPPRGGAQIHVLCVNMKTHIASKVHCISDIDDRSLEILLDWMKYRNALDTDPATVADAVANPNPTEPSSYISLAPSNAKGDTRTFFFGAEATCGILEEAHKVWADVLESGGAEDFPLWIPDDLAS